MTKDFLKLGGRVAIVTGSGSGIGMDIAIKLAEYGAKVMLCCRTEKNGCDVKKRIEDAGGAAEYFRCDVMDSKQVDALIRYTLDCFGRVDLLVNNAGGGAPSREFYDLSDEDWDYMIRFNLYSQFYVTRACFPHMMKQRYGRIVNISTGYAIGGGDWCAAYASAKAGVIGFTTSIAKEGAPYNITCNVIPVPTTDTPAMRACDTPEQIEEEIAATPLKRIATTDDIANATMYLLSDAASFVTGQILAPNGGKRMLV